LERDNTATKSVEMGQKQKKVTKQTNLSQTCQRDGTKVNFTSVSRDQLMLKNSCIGTYIIKELLHLKQQ
jgi:hypothetical protein